MKKLVVANWKMNGDKKLIDQFSLELDQYSSLLNVIICPPTLFLDYALSKSHVCYWGAQDCSVFQSGSHTGEISASLLANLGVKYVLIGHSERRIHIYESNLLIAQKIQIALKMGLIPIFCVGEPLEEFEQGRSADYVMMQIDQSTTPNQVGYMIAYEPIWAIGSGLTASCEHIQLMNKAIAKQRPGSKILYGGSVNLANYEEILRLDTVDGVLVGGASLISEDFFKMVAFTQTENQGKIHE